MENNEKIYMLEQDMLSDFRKYRNYSNIAEEGKTDSTVQSENRNIYIFAHFDICNFTRYKREHKDWPSLLKKYISSINPIPSWSVSKFWKFNGDSLTFRRKIKSIYEICDFIKNAQIHLNKLQEYMIKTAISYTNDLTREELYSEKVYIKSAVWIASVYETPYKQNNTPLNIRISVDNKEEFVGVNIDEGFRLCESSKAGKLVVDPKIVALLYLYDNSFSDNDNHYVDDKDLKYVFSISSYIDNNIDSENSIEKTIHEIMKQSKPNTREKVYFDLFEKTKSFTAQIENSDDFSKECRRSNNISKDFYLMEYAKCKGVWNDRDYPIFWYIPSIEDDEFIYDETVNQEKLRNHDLYKIKLLKGSDRTFQLNTKYEEYKMQLFSSIEQNGIMSTLHELATSLTLMPEGPSEDSIFAKANLYYMVMCIVKDNDKDLGALIFKRKSTRHHLKNVWDLIPIKHSLVYSNTFSLTEYLGVRLLKQFNLTSDEMINSGIEFSFVEDKLRKSVVPYSICNIYRHSEVHNGVMCVAEFDISNCGIDSFKKLLNSKISSTGYSSYRIVPLECIVENNDGKAIKLEDTIIHSLSIDKIMQDSIAVSENSDANIFKNITKELGIAYLADSIYDILRKRVRE